MLTMDKNMKKWPQTETRSQTGAFTLLEKFTIINVKTVKIKRIFFQ